FGKPVLRETPDLLKNPIDELGAKTASKEPLLEPSSQTINGATGTPGADGPTELIGLPRAETREVDGHLHDLFLEKRNPQSLLEDPAKLGMFVLHRLLPPPSLEIGVDHFSDDGTGPDDGDLDDEVVVAPGQQPAQHVHLGTGLDLEGSDRVRPLDHLIGR